LNCRDPIATEKFYTRHFGFRRARVIPLGDDQILFLKLGETYLELFRSQGESPVQAPGKDGHTFPGTRHLAFQVDDVDAKIAQMGAEAKVTLGPLSFDDFIPGWRTVWIADPDDRIIEISQGFSDQTAPPPLREA
jgi:glyoxylase I family protein